MESQTFKTIFLDRDGVINQEPGPILSVSQFQWIPRSVHAIQELKDSGFQIIVITNQGCVARNELSIHTLTQIHEHMNQALQHHHTSIDGLYYCPHYHRFEQSWNSELCIPCECRKPGTGLFKQAAQEHQIDWNHAWFVGDSSSDFEAAFRQGIPSIGVQTGHAGKDGRYDRVPDYWFSDLYDAAQFLKAEAN